MSSLLLKLRNVFSFNWILTKCTSLNSIKFSLNSASTKSAISDDIMINKNKNINRNIKYKFKLTEKNNQNKENNKIIDLTIIQKKKKKSINIVIDKLSRKIDINKCLNKRKLIGLYTEYDSKINNNCVNNNIKNECMLNSLNYYIHHIFF